MRVIFSRVAFRAILSEVANKSGMETGGVFLGYHRDDSWYVIETIAPGPKAVFQIAYFEYDQEYIAREINNLAATYQADLTLIGLWHKHPGAYNEFSTTDDRTNSEFAKLSADGIISVLVNTDPALMVTPYHVSWPLRYNKIRYIVEDALIPERLLKKKTP